MSLDDIRSLWWSGGAALWHVKLHLSYLGYLLSTRSLTYRHKESVSKSHLGRWQLKCDFPLWQCSALLSELCFVFLDEKEKWQKRLVYEGLGTQTKRKSMATIASISSNIQYIGVVLLCTFPYESLLWKSNTRSFKKRGFQRVTKDKQRSYP